MRAWQDWKLCIYPVFLKPRPVAEVTNLFRFQPLASTALSAVFNDRSHVVTIITTGGCALRTIDKLIASYSAEVTVYQFFPSFAVLAWITHVRHLGRY